MIRKMVFTIFAFALGLFGGSRVGGFPMKIATSGTVAWAQDSDGSGGEVGQPELKGPPPLNVAGPWCGSLDDMDLGSGTINLAVKQKRTKLSGSFSDTLGGSGKFKGKISGEAITATLTLRGSRCKIAMVGTLVSRDEVTGTYSIFGCRQSDGGTFDITSPSC